MMLELFEAMDQTMANELKVSLEEYISKIESLDEIHQEKIIIGILSGDEKQIEEAYKLYHSL